MILIKFPDDSKNIFLLSDFQVKVQVRYLKNKKETVEREWFVNNFSFISNKQEYFFSELVIKFNHIDNDNPEFFLQPGQIIFIPKAKLEVINFLQKKFVLIVDKFQQSNEE